MSPTPFPPDRRSVTTSVALYRVLLCIYPAAFRRLYGPQMVQAFRDSCRQASALRGLAGVLVLWLPTLADLMRTACAERLLLVRQLSRTQVVRLCGLLALAGGVLALPLLLLQWWMTMIWDSPTFHDPYCQPPGCTVNATDIYSHVSSLGAVVVLILQPLVALCLLCGLLGVLLLQQQRWAKRLASLALLVQLGQLGVNSSTALGGDPYVLVLVNGLRHWLAQSTGLKLSVLFIPLVVVYLLALFGRPVAVILCGVCALRTLRSGAWRVMVLLLGGVIAVHAYWLPLVDVLFIPHLGAYDTTAVIDTGLALVESVLWAGLGYALWVRKAEPLVRAAQPAL